MTTEGLWAETWQPGNRLGFVTSISSACFLAVFFWWVGIIDTGATITSLSAIEVVVSMGFGLLLGSGALAIHARAGWRDRWRTSMRLRAIVAAPLVVVIGALLIFSPPVASLTFAVMANIFVPGRTYLYLTA